MEIGQRLYGAQRIDRGTEREIDVGERILAVEAVEAVSGGDQR